MHLVELTVAGNEASDLLRVHDPELLAELEAESAFWTVLDEGPVEQCLALLVHSQHGWSAHHVAAQAGEQTGRTEDAEALARHDGWVYVLGSHFGSKNGPLQPKRAFVARFRESATPVLEIVRHRFALHRAVNDALAELTGPAHAPVHESFVVRARERGLAKGKSWVDQLRPGDHPINIEGAAFTARGTLLVGLRWPVTQSGEPILVELAGVPELFSGGSLTVAGAHALAGAGPGPLGVRALCARARRRLRHRDRLDRRARQGLRPARRPSAGPRRDLPAPALLASRAASRGHHGASRSPTSRPCITWRASRNGRADRSTSPMRTIGWLCMRSHDVGGRPCHSVTPVENRSCANLAYSGRRHLAQT